jgi:hypothetical protein
MNPTDTKIIFFKDMNDSVFTLKQGKSYNTNKTSCKSVFGKNFYGFSVTNCVVADKITMLYADKSLRDLEYTTFLNTYLEFNGMNVQ